MRDALKKYVFWYYRELPNLWEDVLHSVLVADVECFEEDRERGLRKVFEAGDDS